MTSASVYVSGATGYIGGAVTAKLLATKKYSITALVRSPEKAAKLESQGIKTVLGTLRDSAIIEEQAFQHDITITMADTDSFEEVQALVKGLVRKHKVTGKRGFLVQTSGSDMVQDTTVADGNQENKTIYSDMDTSTLENLPENYPHRQVNSFLLEQSRSTNAFDLSIVTPCTIFGTTSTVGNPLSSQIPWLVDCALLHGAVYQVGQGINTWSFVHIDDLTNLYALVVDQWLTTKKWYPGFYFPESGYYDWKLACQTVAKHLHALSAISSPKPKIIKDDESFDKIYTGLLPYKFLMAGNSRISGDKCRQLGWSPKKTMDDFLADIEYLCNIKTKKDHLA